MIFDPVEHGNYQLLKKTLLQTQLTFAGQNLCSNIRFRLETYSLIWGDDKRYLASITIQVWRKDEEFKPEKHCLKYLSLKRLYNSGGNVFLTLYRTNLYVQRIMKGVIYRDILNKDLLTSFMALKMTH